MSPPALPGTAGRGQHHTGMGTMGGEGSAPLQRTAAGTPSFWDGDHSGDSTAPGCGVGGVSLLCDGDHGVHREVAPLQMGTMGGQQHSGMGTRMQQGTAPLQNGDRGWMTLLRHGDPWGDGTAPGWGPRWGTPSLWDGDCRGDSMALGCTGGWHQSGIGTMGGGTTPGWGPRSAQGDGNAPGWGPWDTQGQHSPRVHRGMAPLWMGTTVARHRSGMGPGTQGGSQQRSNPGVPPVSWLRPSWRRAWVVLGL